MDVCKDLYNDITTIFIRPDTFEISCMYDQKLLVASGRFMGQTLAHTHTTREQQDAGDCHVRLPAQIIMGADAYASSYHWGTPLTFQTTRKRVQIKSDCVDGAGVRKSLSHS